MLIFFLINIFIRKKILVILIFILNSTFIYICIHFLSENFNKSFTEIDFVELKIKNEIRFSEH